MRSWNYRVLKFVENEDVIYGIHEVHYTRESPRSYTIHPVPVSVVVGGHDDSGPDALAEVLDLMKGALGKPVLTLADFPDAGDEPTPKTFARRDKVWHKARGTEATIVGEALTLDGLVRWVIEYKAIPGMLHIVNDGQIDRLS